MKRYIRTAVFLALLGLLGACAPRVQEVVEEVALPDFDTFGPTFYCGYRKGAELPHQVFAPSGPVSLALLGGESAAVGVEEGYALEGNLSRQTLLVHYPGSLDGCLFPPIAGTFEPGGSFVLVHVFGGERERIYSLDGLNEEPRGMRAYEALTPLGERVGVLVFVEEWVDADYNDAVLLLKGTEPLR